jgi:GNAT superfamily N-acetyltransferase
MEPNERVVIEQVEAAVVLPLRRRVLRPGSLASQAAFDGDDDLHTVHVAARVGGAAGHVVAVGTALVEMPPWGERLTSWRIRGMATDERWRRRGLGSQVLAALLDEVAARGGELVWCSARLSARSLYARAGFTARGDVYDVAGLGPHVVMWRSLTTG